MKKAFIMCAAIVCASTLGAQTNLKLGSDNIDAVVKAMTLEEKATLVVGTGMAGFATGPVVGSTGKIVPGAAGTTAPIERLGIPAVVLSDGPAGLRINPTRPFDSKTYYCTHFPIGICLASTWNTDLVKQVGNAIGEEVRDYGADVILSPAMNIHRNPLNGRNFEYYSEDPVLAGNIAAAYIIGVQQNGVGTSLKHFAVNNQETQRMGNDARVSQRALREIYLKGFQIAIEKAQPWTVMTSYNLINGTMTSESKELLNTVLRKEWGFKGLIMTDWFGGMDPVRRNGLADRIANMQAGNDLIEPGTEEDSKAIVEAVKCGKLKEADLNANVRRVLELIVRSPRFKGYQFSNNPDLKGHATITRNSAVEGAVLLKNDGTLPFNKNIKKLAVYGCSSYDIIAGGTGSGNVNRGYTISLIEGLRNNGYTVNQDILEKYQVYLDDFKKAHANDVVDILTVPELPKEITFSTEDLAKSVSENDAALITIGRICGEGSDRCAKDFNLSDAERQLISTVSDAFQKAGKTVTVILNIGNVMETASWKNIPNAILLPWQSGQEVGNSIADILSGRKTPSGKLSDTWPIRLEEHYSSKNFPLDAPKPVFLEKNRGDVADEKNVGYTNYEEDIYVGYRYFDTFKVNVSYPFGYGLSYTTFAYSNPTVTDNGDDVEVSVTITNTGKYSGKEVAEVYVTAPAGEVEKPEQELKAFAKTKELQPGESQMLTMTIAKADLGSFHENQSAWITDAGTYLFKVGASSRDIKGTASLNIKQQKTKVNPVLKPQVTLNLLTNK